MARWLIIGGTRFVGHHIAQAAIDAGHELTLFHRGHTPARLEGPCRELLRSCQQRLCVAACGVVVGVGGGCLVSGKHRVLT